MKSSAGVAKINNMTAETSNAPVPTSVCFSNLMTGLTWRQKELLSVFSVSLCVVLCVLPVNADLCTWRPLYTTC